MEARRLAASYFWWGITVFQHLLAWNCLCDDKKKENLFWDTFCNPYPVGFVLAANFVSLMFLVVNRFLAENSCLLRLETRPMRAVWVKRNIVGSKTKTMWQKSEVIKSRVIPFMSLDPLLIYKNICLHIALNKQTCVRPLSTKWNKSSNICWLTGVNKNDTVAGKRWWWLFQCHFQRCEHHKLN